MGLAVTASGSMPDATGPGAPVTNILDCLAAMSEAMSSAAGGLAALAASGCSANEPAGTDVGADADAGCWLTLAYGTPPRPALPWNEAASLGASLFGASAARPAGSAQAVTHKELLRRVRHPEGGAPVTGEELPGPSGMERSGVRGPAHGQQRRTTDNQGRSGDAKRLAFLGAAVLTLRG